MQKGSGVEKTNGQWWLNRKREGKENEWEGEEKKTKRERNRGEAKRGVRDEGAAEDESERESERRSVVENDSMVLRHCSLLLQQWLVNAFVCMRGQRKILWWSIVRIHRWSRCIAFFSSSLFHLYRCSKHSISISIHLMCAQVQPTLSLVSRLLFRQHDHNGLFHARSLLIWCW